MHFSPIQAKIIGAKRLGKIHFLPKVNAILWRLFELCRNHIVMKNILILNGNPRPDCYSEALAKAYEKGAKESGHQVTYIAIRELEFDPNLRNGFSKTETQALEPDLKKAQMAIAAADHIVWVHPIWWGGLPAITKGFIDRVFEPGFAFKYRENSVWWDKLLAGKTGRIIYTLDQPVFFYKWINGQPGVYQLKKMTMEFCGIKTKTTGIGPIRKSTEDFRLKWIMKIQELGKKSA